LVDSDGEINGGDLEDNVAPVHFSASDVDTLDEGSNPFANDDSDIDSWKDRGKASDLDGGSSMQSFNSAKLIVGYKDFMVEMQKQQAKRDKEEADAEKHKHGGLEAARKKR